MLRTHLLKNVCLRYVASLRSGGLAAATTAATTPATHGCRQRYAMPASRTTFPAGSLSYSTVGAVGELKGSGERTTRKKRTRKASEGVVANVEDLWIQLEQHYQQHGILRHEHCERLLQQLEANQKQSLGADQLHFLLGACVPELLPVPSSSERLALFRRLWAQLLRVEQPTLSHYHTQLQMLQQNQLPLPDHRTLLAEIAIYNGAPDAALYSALLDVAGATGNMRQATELLNEMRQCNFPLTESNFHALLLGHARSGDLPGADSVLSSMRAAGITPNPTTQSLCFVAYIENGELDKGRELLRQHAGSFHAPQLLQMLRAVLSSQVQDVQLMQQLVSELPAEYVHGGDVPPAINSICIQLLHRDQAQLVIQLIGMLPAPSYNENQNIDGYASLLLLELFRARTPLQQMLQFATQLRERGQNRRALELLTELALRRQPSLALACLEALREAGEPLRPHYFWPLLLEQHKRDGENGMLRLLAEMQRLGVECDESTLCVYVLPNLWQTLQQPLQALQKLDTIGIRASQSLIYVLGQLLQQQQMQAALDLLERYPTRLQLVQLLQPLAALAVNVRANKRYEIFAKLTQALQQRSLQRQEDFVGALLLQMCAPQTRLRMEPAALLRFLHELQRLQLQLSPAAAETLLSIVNSSSDAVIRQSIGSTLQKMRNTELTLPPAMDNSLASGGFIKHPRDMSLDELECHLIELEAKQLNTRGVLRRLLQLSVRDNRLERALELLAKCESLHVQTSPGMLASIFELHIKRKDLRRANQTLQRIQQTYPGFQLDEHKLIDYASLLVHENQLDAAKELLQQRALQQRVNGGDYVIKNVWQLLNNVAQLAVRANLNTETSLSLETFEFLRKLGYCQAHNALLGPVVREWLLRGNLDEAVSEFQRLATRFKHTPLQFEMLSLLVKLSNGDETELARFPGTTIKSAQQHLGSVTATVSRVHGDANMNSALLLALAESGTETQLRRLIINPEFRLNHELLLKNCEHLGQEGAIRTLIRLARGVRGLQRTIDEQRIYDMLLAQFAKNNNYEGAIDLYERLQADDELKVSLDFVRNLVKLLQLNNIEIPSSIAMRAQIR
ncbi:leucine-rich PPR motif-containing protein, mitochondrial [Drosophila grimshawi]|uniref:GH24085 n=1 Tax=Drosophila grimshawi TaxID=7222 RepID=B4JNT5_DROGR|nr:leucine-rich PPR motif-containing protein, mitochondrial [Drosophila grimshawi]EDV92378.1 GH24085 [Drosophila grimshawi]